MTPSQQVLKFLSDTPVKHNLSEYPRMQIRVLVQWWPEQDERIIGEVMDYLLSVQDVSDPIADENSAGPIKYAGSWRVVDITSGRRRGLLPDKQGVYRTLVNGSFAQAQWTMIKDDCESKIEMMWFWNMPAIISPYDSTTFGDYASLFVPAPGKTPGVVYQLENVTYDKIFGTFGFTISRTTYHLMQTGPWKSAVSAGETEVSSSAKGINPATRPDLVADPIQVKGTASTLELSKRSDCLYDALRADKTPNDLPGESKSEDTFEQTKEASHSQNPTDLLAGNPDIFGLLPDGQAREVSSKENDVGNFTTSDEVKTGKPVVGAESTITDDVFHEEQSRTDKNQTNAQIAAAGLTLDGGGNLIAPTQQSG